MSISQTDLLVRLQLLGCKYGDLANTYANTLKWGMKCSKENLSKLIMLNTLIEILECYDTRVLTTPILPTVVFHNEKGYFGIGDFIELQIEGTPVIGVITFDSTDILEQLGQIYDALIAEGYTAVITGDDNACDLEITLPCTNPTVDIVVNDINTVNLPYDEIGDCTEIPQGKNCLTEEQLLSLLDKIANLVKQCFMPIGFEYEIPEGYEYNSDGELVETT